LYTLALRPALFSLDAERAHDLTMAALRQPVVTLALRLTRPSTVDSRLRQHVLGQQFDHPLGLAAGLDKQGTAAAAWSAIGFSFAEIGTVTPRPQSGNPRPRLFRLRQDAAIINRFGFNSAGAAGVARNLSAGTAAGLVVGINIGRNKETSNDRAVEDYLAVVDALHPFAHYFVVNVSSPNTERLRDLQQGRTLRLLVEAVVAGVRRARPGREIPVLVKVSPDNEAADLLASVDAALQGGAAGIVATNTTVARPPLAAPAPLAQQAGGLSGSPLKGLATGVCQLLFRHIGGRVPIVGVGGVRSADDAYARIRSGATLVQLYTALIYEGPGVVRRIVDGLAERLTQDGFSNIAEAIGVDVR
jgi:dihydroorotate dehydrogenase